MQETWVWSLGPEDHLEEEMATHSSILVWEIPWTEQPGKLHSPLGCQSLTRLSKHAYRHSYLKMVGSLLMKKQSWLPSSHFRHFITITFLWWLFFEAHSRRLFLNSQPLYSSINSSLWIIPAYFVAALAWWVVFF